MKKNGGSKIMTAEVIRRGNVVQRAINKEITQARAAEELGLTERQVRRLVFNFRKEGLEGLMSGHKGGNHRLSNAIREQAVGLVAKYYPGFGPKSACEKLRESYNVCVSRETLRKWMIDAGIWEGKKRKKASIHQPKFGELVQIDSSHHD